MEENRENDYNQEEIIANDDNIRVQESGNPFLSYLKNFVIFIVVFLLIKACHLMPVYNNYQKITSNTDNSHSQTTSAPVAQKQKYTEQEIYDASFVFGFKYSSTDATRQFCSETGYVPEAFIKLFEESFVKTIENSNKILNASFTASELSGFKYQAGKEMISMLESDYSIAASRVSSLTKEDYCKIIDNEKETILAEKKRMFIEAKPHMFLD